MRGLAGVALAAMLAGLPGPARATAPSPSGTLEIVELRVTFRVQSRFTVEGTFGPVEGAVRFTPTGGPMSGELRIAAATADTGYGLRDAVIREDVLEADLHPSIVIRPDRWQIRGRDAAQLSGTLWATLEMHGVERPITVDLELQAASEPDGRAEGVWRVRCGFAVSFEDWGIANPGNRYLPVDPTVGVIVSGVVRTRALD